MANPAERPANCRDRVDMIMKTLDEVVMALDGITGHEPSDTKDLKEPSDTILDVLVVKLERLQEQANYIARQIKQITNRL